MELNACRNEVVVGSADDVVSLHLNLADCHWIREIPSGGVQVKIRSVSHSRACQVKGVTVLIPAGVLAAAKGQSAVFYRDDEVLGGGIISEVFA